MNMKPELERVLRRGCVGKTRWPDMEQARGNLLAGKKKGHYTGDYSVYLCKFCGFWHVGGRRTKYRRRIWI